MNKKVLVLTLALVVAFAGSAMAAVTIGGDFTATAKQTNFKVFKESYEFTSKLQMKISASNSDVTTTSEVVETTVVDEETGEEIVVLETKENKQTNWDFSARLNSWTTDGATQFELDRYKLELKDQYFTAWVWGGQNLTDKATYFDMIKAAKEPGDGMRARVLVPVMDLAKVTADFAAEDNARFFVEGEVEGFNVGLAYARTNWTTEATKADVIVGQVGTAVPAGDLSVDLEAAAGITLGEDLGFALGLGAETNITEELELKASVTTANEHWRGDSLKANNTVLSTTATYTEDLYQVNGTVKHTFIKDADGKNEITLGAKYRMSEKVAYNRLFNTNTSYVMWYENDAPAFGVDVKFVDFKFDNVEAKAAAPVVDDMVWAMATGKYLGDSKFEATARGRVVATDKLTLTQYVGYKSADKAFDVQLGASYKIGLSDTTIGFKAEKVFNEAKNGKGLLEASIKVPF